MVENVGGIQFSNLAQIDHLYGVKYKRITIVKDYIRVL